MLWIICPTMLLKVKWKSLNLTVRALIAERVAYKKAISEHAKLLEKFITSRWATQVKELRADPEKVNENLEKAKKFAC